MVFGRQMSIFASIFLGGLLASVALLMLAPTVSWGESPERVVDRDAAGRPYVAGELIVTYEPGAGTGARERTHGEAEALVEERLPEVRAQLLSLPEVKDELAQGLREEDLEDAKRRLERDPAVEAVDYNYLRFARYAPDDPELELQYGLQRSGFTGAWDRTRGAAGTKIAVVDGGIEDEHPDIEGKVVAQRDFVDGDGVAEDDDGHGTHVAGIAAAVTDNGEGVAGGCPDCGLLVAKVMDADGYVTIADEIAGIKWAADNGAKVINLSLGGRGSSRAERNAVEYAWKKGAVVVAAAGNADSSVPEYPAAYQSAIAVAGTNSSDRRDPFSNHGGWVDVAAPSVRILSTVPGGYKYESGTSMASPYVSALAGLLASQGRTKTGIRSRILGTATDLGEAGRDDYYGAGRINASRAVQ